MQQINGKTSMDKTQKTQKIEQYTTVYHVELGKGQVVSVTYRKNNNLVMCYFPNGRCHDWLGENEIRGGVGDITLSKHDPVVKNDDVPDSLQSVLESLFTPIK